MEKEIPLQLEYKEISQDIRESWKYITALLRNFLIIQLALISMLGLGNILYEKISIENAKYDIKFASNAKMSNIELKRDEGKINYDKGTGVRERGCKEKNMKTSCQEKFKEEKKRKIIDMIRKSTIFALLASSIISTIFFGVQFWRMFSNAEKFVFRAAAIEKEMGLDDINREPPLHIYMRSRLNTKTVSMKALVIIVISFACIFWMWIALNYAFWMFISN